MPRKTKRTNKKRRPRRYPKKVGVSNTNRKTNTFALQTRTKAISIPGLNPIPRAWTCNHKYVEHDLNLSTTSGSTEAFSFNLMNLFQVKTSGGHQPLGRDTFVLLYDSYRVNYVNYKFTFYGMSGSGVPMVVMPRSLSFSPSVPWSLVAEKAGALCKMVSVQGNDAERSLTGRLYPNQLLGITRNKYNTENAYSSLSTGAPDAAAFVDIYSGSRAPGDSTTIYLKAELHYNVTWFNPKILAQS